MLTFKPDGFQGVEVEGALPDSAEIFSTQLAATLNACGGTYQHIWLNIPISYAQLISAATAQGFDFHHCTDGTQSGEATLTLCKLLAADAYVIHGPTHYVGVGAVVLNARNELLVVREQRHAEHPGRYKLPGGYIDPGELIAETAVREVGEETGVQTRFRSLHSFRHLKHANPFNCANLYLICRLEPLTEATTPEAGEILEVCWMPVDEFLALDTVMAHPKGMVQAVLESAEAGLTIQHIENYNNFTDEQIELFLPKT